MSDKALDTGAWAGDIDELLSALLSGQGSDTDLPDPVRFRLAVQRMILRREKLDECEYDRTAAMVLVPATFFESPPAGSVRCPLLHTGHHTLTGHMHFLGVSAGGRSLAYEGDDGGLFDSLAAVQAEGLPTLVYSPKAGGQSMLSWYPEGTGKLDKVTSIPVRFDEPTSDLIAQAINGVYFGHLITPDMVPNHLSPWANPGQGQAAENAEAQVQHAVKIGLHGRWPLCRIVAEIPGKDGRTDIEIIGEFGRPAGEVTHYAVLELKVLREKGSTGNVYSTKQIATHIDEGLDQAYTYGGGRNFIDRMLCLFDMRAANGGPDLVLNPIRPKAKTLGVDVRYWFLYRSSKILRACVVGKTLKAG